MPLPTLLRTFVEPLESRIAPALTVLNPLADITAGIGSKGALVDLSQIFDAQAAHPNHTIVTFTTNFDANPNAEGVQPGVIVLEMLDDEAPFTVQNFLRYATSKDASGDYAGTFFHRAVTDPANGLEILQGGGFNAKSTSHINTILEVHNEFDPARSNVRGTVAMAKVGLEQGGGPNSATSEFFINAGDNSSNLDNQNGGFTVFARVIQGMDVVDQILALRRFDADKTDNAAGILPVQNYDFSSNPPVTRANRIVIEDVQVSAEKGNAAGITFNVLGVTDLAGNATDLLTAQVVNGSDLRLKYADGKNGLAKVRVEASQNGVTAVDEFVVEVRPNLIADLVRDPFSGVIAPGDTGTVKLRLGNNAAGLVETNVNVTFFLSKALQGSADPGGVLFDAGDIEIGRIVNAPVSLAGGETVKLSTKLRIPDTLASVNGESYRVIAKVEPGQGGAFDQHFSDDDNAIDGGLHRLFNFFGTAAGRTGVQLTYTESDGDRVTLSLEGKGVGVVTPQASGAPAIDVTETSKRSVLRATTEGGGRVEIGSLGIAQVIDQISLGAANLSGFLTATGGVRAITLGNVSGDAIMTIGAFGSANTVRTQINLGKVQDLSLESLMPIGSLRATEWLDTTGRDDFLFASKMKSLRITGGNGVRGDFEANVTLTSESTLSSFVVAGSVNDATIKTNGDIRLVKVGAVNQANFFAGLDERPATRQEARDGQEITRFVLTGIDGVARAFVDSQVAARLLGEVVLRGGVSGESADGDVGFTADAVESYRRANGPSITNVRAPDELDRIENYVLKIL